MIERLPVNLRNTEYIATLSDTSHDPAKGEYPCSSQFEVINLNPMFYDMANSIGCHMPKDCDALFVAKNGDFSLIEFKNTTNIKPSEILQKVYDSIIAMIELEIIPNVQAAREKGSFVLVFEPSDPEKDEMYMRQQAGEGKYNLHKFQYLIDLLGKGYVLKTGGIQSFDDFHSNLVPLIENDESLLPAVSSILQYP